MENRKVDQVETNYVAFVAELPRLIRDHRGQYALMHDGKIDEFFDSAGQAFCAGRVKFGDVRAFSVQEVDDQPIDLGLFSHAIIDAPN